MTTPALYPGVDASRPGQPLPPGTRILAAYVGIANQYGPDTPYIWTKDDWNSYHDQDPSIAFLPIYTHNYGGDPVADANNACDAIGDLGWVAHVPGDHRRILAIDLEILVDPNYVAPLFEQINERGYSPMPYGSAFYVAQNPSGIGYWEALLTPNPPTVLPAGVQGIQWKWANWDYDLFSQRVLDGCGIGPRG
jgi:hypothetical protein